jgi:hypothetical protein
LKPLKLQLKISGNNTRREFRRVFKKKEKEKALFGKWHIIRELLPFRI